MYTAVLALHSWLRWVVLLLGILAVVRGIAGASGRRRWTPADERAGLFFTIALDVQLLIGLLLYFVFSPITRAALGDWRWSPSRRRSRGRGCRTAGRSGAGEGAFRLRAGRGFLPAEAGSYK
jgi:hypothetical protein